MSSIFVRVAMRRAETDGTRRQCVCRTHSTLNVPTVLGPPPGAYEQYFVSFVFSFAGRLEKVLL
eukprot:3230624-Amphidinium_carterae.1